MARAAENHRAGASPMKLILKLLIPVSFGMCWVAPAAGATVLLGAPVVNPFGVTPPPNSKPIPPRFTYTPPADCDPTLNPQSPKCGEAWGLNPKGPGGFDVFYIWLKNEAKPHAKKTFVLDIVFKQGIVIGLPLINNMVDPNYLPNIYWDTPHSAKDNNWKSAALFLMSDGRQGLQLIKEKYPQPAYEAVDYFAWKVKFKVNNVFQDENFRREWMDSITVSSHCPEPTTWALMIVGFGMVGGVSRSQRRKIGEPAQRSS